MIRKSVVLQVARLRVTTALDRFGWRPEIDPPLRTYLADAPPEIDERPRGGEGRGGALAALTASQGARLVVVLLPARFQVDDGDYGRLKEIVARSGQDAGPRSRHGTFLEGAGGSRRARAGRAAAASRGRASLRRLHAVDGALHAVRARCPRDDPRAPPEGRGPRSRGRDADGLQLPAFRRVLPGVSRSVSPPAAPGPELAARRRQLLLLRILGLALPGPARRLHADGVRVRRAVRPPRRREAAEAGARTSASACTSRCWGSSSTSASSRRTCRPCSASPAGSRTASRCRCCCLSASRSTPSSR